MQFIVFFSLIIAIVTAQKAVWPPAFTAETSVYSNGKTPLLGDWYYSKKLNCERWDQKYETHVESYLVETIRNHTANKEWVLTIKDSQLTCVVSTIKDPLPDPDFKNFIYEGKSQLVDWETYYWSYVTGTQGIVDYYQEISTGQPRRISAVGTRGKVSTTFFSMDIAPVNPDLFYLPSSVTNLCTQG